MGRICALALAKTLELRLIIVLWNTYGDLSSPGELWRRLASESELTQIGTATAIAIIIGIFAATLMALIQMIEERWLRTFGTGHNQLGSVK